MSVEQLINYLGVDSDSSADINIALKAAQETLKRTTGKDWSKITDNAVADEAIQAMVYRNYWAIRDSAKNTEFLERFITQKIKLLQYCDDVEAASDGAK